MIEKIAKGEGFDVVDGMRALAKEVLLLRAQGTGSTPNMAAEAAPTTADHAFYGLFDKKVADALLSNGYEDIEAVRKAHDSDLTRITGIGPKTVLQIREALG